ncbi:MAG: hypothetical protein ACYCVN_01015 [Acidimicrobiales bacterium]
MSAETPVTGAQETSAQEASAQETIVVAPRSSGSTRYRCTACGNLTRFDVVTTRRTKAFHHYSVGGELTVEDEQVLDEVSEQVSCRWCGHGDAISVVDDAPEGE